MHGATAEVLEELYEGRTGEINVGLAYHWEQAGESRKAAQYLQRAGMDLWKIGADGDAIGFYERGLAMLPEDDVAGRAELLVWAGWSYHNMRDLPTSVPLFGEGVVLSRKAGLPAVEAEALQGLGRSARYQGRYDEAERYLERAIEVARQSGDQGVLAGGLFNMGGVAFDQEDLEKAERLAKESLALFRESGYERDICFALGLAGVVARMRGEFGEHERYAEELLAIYREIGSQGGVAWCFLVLGDGARQQGEYAEAVEYYEECLAIYRQLGEILAYPLDHLGHAHIGLDEDDVAWGYLREALKESLAAGWVSIRLEILIGVAWLRAKAGRHARAAELLGLVMGHPKLDQQARRYYTELVLAMVREALPAGEVEAALARGEGLDLEQVVGEILAGQGE